MLFLAVILSATVVQQTQAIECVTSCGANGVVIGQFNLISSCCGIIGVSGLGYEFAGEAGNIICQGCGSFNTLQSDISFVGEPTPIVIGENFTANCIVMTNPMADATVNITWRLPNGTIATEQSIMSPTATVPLTFQPFEASDLGEYSCSAAITSPQLPDTVTVIESSLGISGSSDIFRVSINEDTPPVAGEPYTLTCQVNGTGGTPSIEWVGPNSQPIVNGSGITVGDPVTVGTVTTSSLMFSAISLFDNGRYMCRNDLVFPSTATRTVRVNVPQPEIVFTSALAPVVGQPYQIDCSGTVPDSLSGNVTASWIDETGAVIASQQGIGSATAALSFNMLQLSDAGTYTCIVTVTSNLLNRPLRTSRSLNLTIEAISVDECAQGLDNCDVNAMCIDLPQGFQCTCNSGFTGDGITCTELVDECAQGLDNCDVNAKCIDLPQGFQCVCNSGFTGDGVNCTDIDECSLGTDSCDRRKLCRFSRLFRYSCMRVSVCTNTPGGFNCSCRTGFTGSGTRCRDINECLEGLDNCHSRAICINTAGSFWCLCRRGFEGDGVTCCPRPRSKSRYWSPTECGEDDSDGTTTTDTETTATDTETTATDTETTATDTETTATDTETTAADIETTATDTETDTETTATDTETDTETTTTDTETTTTDTETTATDTETTTTDTETTATDTETTTTDTETTATDTETTATDTETTTTDTETDTETTTTDTETTTTDTETTTTDTETTATDTETDTETTATDTETTATDTDTTATDTETTATDTETTATDTETTATDTETTATDT